MDQQLLDKVKTYQIPQAAIDLLTEHLPVLLAGTTAAGKETVIQAIQDEGLGAKVVTHTTRPPREGEHNGKNYWFVSEERMLELVEKHSFIEVKEIHEQQVSGSSIEAYKYILDQGLDPLLAVDIQGIEEIMKHVPGIKPVFILPPSFETWMERLDRRGNMSHVERLRRLHSARVELQKAVTDPHFVLIVNQDIHQTAKAVMDGLTDSFTQHRNRELAEGLINHINAY